MSVHSRRGSGRLCLLPCSVPKKEPFPYGMRQVAEAACPAASPGALPFLSAFRVEKWVRPHLDRTKRPKKAGRQRDGLACLCGGGPLVSALPFFPLFFLVFLGRMAPVAHGRTPPSPRPHQRRGRCCPSNKKKKAKQRRPPCTQQRETCQAHPCPPSTFSFFFHDSFLLVPVQAPMYFLIRRNKHAQGRARQRQVFFFFF
nr:hypothetical protein [Pandoravirus massiliensis]